MRFLQLSFAVLSTLSLTHSLQIDGSFGFGLLGYQIAVLRTKKIITWLLFMCHINMVKTKQTARKHSGVLPVATEADLKQRARKRDEDERDLNLDEDGRSTHAQKQPEPTQHSKCM